jgi:O-antigen/teichoic acid export membrane protein
MTKEEFASKKQAYKNISGKGAVIAVSLVLLVAIFFCAIIPILIDTVWNHVTSEWFKDALITGILIVACIVLIIFFKLYLRSIKQRLIRFGLFCTNCGIPFNGLGAWAIIEKTGKCPRCG